MYMYMILKYKSYSTTMSCIFGRILPLIPIKSTGRVGIFQKIVLDQITIEQSGMANFLMF